ncbi:MAG TPA: MASE1 domain-containing protein [Gemmatimonadales bacterium]|nr:MASE1 domain-containing protein [Gemmatimonadales bacterium]
MPDTTRPTPSLPQYAVRLVVLAALYYAAARLGLRYASIGQSISLVWPPTGIAIAALAILGVRYAPAIFAGAILANAGTSVPLSAAAGIALGNTLEAVVAGLLIGRLGRPFRLDNLRHVRQFILVVVPVACLVSAVVGVTTLALTHSLADRSFANAVLIWWCGDVLGGLVVAPVFFAWNEKKAEPTTRTPFLEIVALGAGAAIIGELVFGEFRLPLLGEFDYPYLLFPLVIWAAVRLGSRGASLMSLALAAVAISHTAAGGGPFVSPTPLGTLFALALYLGLVAITGMVLAATVQWERDTATRALQQSEGRLHLALDSARMGIWFWSLESQSLSWDDNLCKLYGLAPGMSVTSHEQFLERVHPDDRTMVAEQVRSSLATGGGLDYEFRILLPDGEVRWIADRGEVGRNEQGVAVFMTGVCMDITERRNIEDRLRMAQRVEAVGRLAGGVAHETNNQMTIVLGAAEFVLRRADLAEPVRDDLQHIRRAAERTAAVTAQLLAFSRRQVLRNQVIRLNPVVTGWEPVLRRIIGEDCLVRLQLAEEIGSIRADPGQLEQVLLNLALNARDAMSRGGTLTIETFRTDITSATSRRHADTEMPPGSYSVLAVSDTGHGMTARTLGHVFEPFFTTKPVGEGSGLGLSTVYGIVKQSGGYVWVYSEPGQGTTFKIYLPEIQPRSGDTRAEAPLAPPHQASGETILIVEDEHAVRHMLRRTLEEAGYRVLESESADAALIVVQTPGIEVHLVLTDVVMPGMTGRELGIRLSNLSPGTPVLYTSGYTDSEIARRGLLDPGTHFLQKPFSPDMVIRRVAELLRSRDR